MDKKAEIEALEQELLQTKSWDMLGETSSRKRPENSLLEKDLDYQRTIKVAPTITEDVTKTIEDMIKQRIRDELWDDVERKMEDKALNPTENLKRYRPEKKSSLVLVMFTPRITRKMCLETLLPKILKNKNYMMR